MSDSKLRRQHLSGQSERFDRAEAGIESIVVGRGQCLSWVNRVILVGGRLLPAYPWKRTLSGSVAISQRCQHRKSRHSNTLSAIASRFDCIDNRRIHIGGVNPSLPYVIRGVCRVPSDCFFAAAMKILVPGLRSLFSPVA
jgi:hypothetical protein